MLRRLLDGSDVINPDARIDLYIRPRSAWGLYSPFSCTIIASFKPPYIDNRGLATSPVDQSSVTLPP